MRRLLKSVLLLLLGLPLLAALAFAYLQWQLDKAGVRDLSFQLRKVSLHQLHLSELSFRLDAPQAATLQLQDVQFSWSWPAFFRVQAESVHIAETRLQLFAPASPATPPQHPFSLNTDWRLPAWLPKQITLPDIQLLLPCPALQCEVSAAASLSNTDNEQYLLQVQASSPELAQALRLDVQYQQQDNQQALQATLLYPEVLALSLKQQLDSERQANTELALAISPLPTELQHWLASWQLLPPAEWLAEFTQPLHFFVNANWQLPQQLQRNSGIPLQDAQVNALLRAPSAFALPFGTVQGEAGLALAITQGEIENWQLSGDLQLSHYLPPALQAALPETAAPLYIRLNTSGDSASLASLPLQLTLSAAAPLALDAQLTAELSLSPELKLSVPEAELAVALAQFTPSPELKLAGTALKGRFSLLWQTDNWQLRNLTPLSLHSQLDYADIQSQLELSASELNLSQHGNNTPLNLNSQLSVKLGQLVHPLLQRQDWQWESTLSGNSNNLALNGKLENSAGLSAQLQAQAAFISAAPQLQLHWQLADIFLLAGNPLAATLKDWPELLSLQRGRILASGELAVTAQRPRLQLQAELRELAGLYDRTLFNGLTARLTAQSDADSLQLHLPQLRIAQLNHGIELGPLLAAADYQASLTAPAAGTLNLQQFETDFLLGKVQIRPQQFQLAASEQQVVLQLNQLDLTELLRQHPSTEVKARGKISGEIPLRWQQQQFEVAAGVLAAEQPGGWLQYKNPAAAASNNPGMKLVFEALDDFHFSELQSEVSYSGSGRLQLALKLQGYNPAVQQGRAINLNITLEEDLPAMLASLQLASKLNDTLTKRVQQYIQQQQAARKAAGDKP